MSGADQFGLYALGTLVGIVPLGIVLFSIGIMVWMPFYGAWCAARYAIRRYRTRPR